MLARSIVLSDTVDSASIGQAIPAPARMLGKTKLSHDTCLGKWVICHDDQARLPIPTATSSGGLV